MVRGRGAAGGPRSSRICPALHGGVTRRSRFSGFLSCESIGVGAGHNDRSILTSFVFPSATRGSLEAASPQMLSALASAAAALSGAHGGDLVGLSAPDVSMACIPFLAPGWASDDADSPGESDGLTERARTYQRGLSATCFAQASIATLQFALNDSMSGLIGCGIAALGMQASSPSGYRFLPSYMVLAFCNGTMQVLVSSELAASHQLLANTSSIGLKLASVVGLASPAIMFIGIAVAWHLQCELRAIALQSLPPNMRSVGGLPGQPTAPGAAAPAPAGAIGQGGIGGQPGDRQFHAFQGQPQRLVEGGEVK